MDLLLKVGSRPHLEGDFVIHLLFATTTRMIFTQKRVHFSITPKIEANIIKTKIGKDITKGLKEKYKY